MPNLKREDYSCEVIKATGIIDFNQFQGDLMAQHHQSLIAAE
jgi:hypothetical protein